MNKKFVPKNLPLFFNGVFYELHENLEYEKLIFFNLNLSIEIYSNNDMIWINGLSKRIKTNVPIKTNKDFNNLSQIMGYGKLLTTKTENIEYNKSIINITDNSISFTEHGIYINNDLVMLFNHKLGTLNYSSNPKIFEFKNQKELYNKVLSSFDKLGWDINHLINSSNDYEIKGILMNIQNKINIHK